MQSISVVNTGGLTNPATLTANSFAQVPTLNQAQPTLVQFTLEGTWAGTLAVYFSTDGSLLESAGNGLSFGQSGAIASIASGVDGTYQIVVPGGHAAYLVATAWVSGTVNVIIWATAAEGDVTPGSAAGSTAPLSAGPVTHQITIATSGTPVGFPAAVCTNGAVITANPNNAALTLTTGGVVGASGVGQTGSNGGAYLQPGASAGLPVKNLNTVFCNGIIGDQFSAYVV